MNNLVEFWRRGQLLDPPFVHSADRAFLHDRALLQNELADKSNRTNFDGYIQGERFSPDDKSLHLSLFPVPYAGNLKKAKIIVLLLNPGFKYSDCWAEYKVPEFRERLKRNINQDFDGFPFMFLDPQFCWSSGFQWWEEKLRDVVSKIAETRSKSYFEALRFLSERLACIELFPYHSSSFRYQKLIKDKELPSVKKARSFVRDYLVPQAKSDKATVIVMRGKAGWEIKKSYKGLCVYGSGQARGASLSTNTDGGKAILKRLGIAI